MPTETADQLDLIDTKHPAAKDILRIVKQIRAHDADRSDAQEKATKAREKLIEVLHEHKLTEFKIDTYVIKLRPASEKVSVRLSEDEEANNGDE